LPCPIHITMKLWGLHVVYKGLAHIAGYIDRLHLECAEINDFAPVIVGHQNHVNVAGRTPMRIIQTGNRDVSSIPRRGRREGRNFGVRGVYYCPRFRQAKTVQTLVWRTAR
jgi:hypothetical protein